MDEHETGYWDGYRKLPECGGGPDYQAGYSLGCEDRNREIGGER